MNRVRPLVLTTGIPALLFAAWAAPFLPLSAEARTLIAAPLYFLLPMGLGLLTLSWRRDVVAALGGRVIVLVWSYFVGLMFVTTLFVAREHGAIWQGETGYWFALICVASLTGFFRQRNLFVYDAAARSAVFGLLCLAPFFFFAYGIQYFLFSDYPYTDLFQFGHLLKGAGEFALFDRLNPFNASSYAPVIQVLLGLEARFFGLDQFFAMWVIPVPAFILRYLVCYSLARQIVPDKRGQIFLAGGILILIGGLVPTNGDLAALGSMLLLSLILQRTPRSLTRPPSWALALFPFVGMLLGVLAARNSILMYMALMLLALFVAMTVQSPGRVLERLILMALLAYVLVPLHRSILLFVVLAVLIGWLYAYSRSGIHPRWRFPVSIAYYGLPSLALLLSLFILWRHGMGEDVQFGLLSLADKLFHAVIGSSVINNQEAMLGLGGTVALFETARSVGWVLVLTGGSVFLAGWGRKVFSSQKSRITANRHILHVSPRLAWVLGMVVVVVILAGVPFVYRAAFFPVLLLCIFCLPALISLKPATTRYWGWMATLYVLIAVFAYGLFGRGISDPYIASYRLFGFLFGLAIVCLGVLVAMRFGRVGKNIWAVPLLMLALLAWDKETARVYFKHYAYGYPPLGMSATPVSHLTAEDFNAAAWLTRYTEDVYVLSDPITMSNMRALTGKNSVVSYSNLDTMPESARNMLKDILRVSFSEDATPGVKMDKGCIDETAVRGYMVSSGNSSEINYVLMRRLRPELSGAEVLALFGYGDGLLLGADHRASEKPAIKQSESNHMWLNQDIPDVAKVIAVIVLSQRTLSWMSDSPERVDYFFANDHRMDDTLRHHLVNVCGGISLDNGLVMVPLTKPSS